ncbi:peptidase S8/S53 domain-containing protein [Mycena olivaceomarginata]|nr:peptidase S8/S53 domain-containing protein [Mycena olivaceomarginata]
MKDTTGASRPRLCSKYEWLDFILQSDHILQTILTSYGDDEQTVPFTYASRVCKLFAQLGGLTQELGVQGVLVLFTSGDGGVGDGNVDTATQQCCTNDKKFHAHISVTAVGGTMSIPEVAVSFSGGGFSDCFPRPAYQDKSINTYLSKLHHGTYDGLFNRLGRARKFQIVWQGQHISIRGISAATPTFMGLVALLNDAHLAVGRPTLGFLNPLLYKTRREHFQRSRRRRESWVRDALVQCDQGMGSRQAHLYMSAAWTDTGASQ